MLKLSSTDPTWLELFPAGAEDPAVRVQFAAITIKAARAARRAVAAALGVDPEDIENAGDELSRELLRRGILAWEGVGDASGNPIDVTAESVELFLANPLAFERADQAYVIPWVQADIAAAAPGKGSPPSQSGTSAEGTQAGTSAGSRAPRARAAGAKNARTPSTSRKRTKKTASGT